MKDIVYRLTQIQEWIDENGFGNRGCPGQSPSKSAEELEKALNTLLNAYNTLARWERFYMGLFIEKALQEYPRIKRAYPEKVHKYEGGWMSFDELDRFYRTILNEIA